MKRTYLVLVSELPQEECADLLRSAGANSWRACLWPGTVVRGRVHGSKFWLQNNNWYALSPQPILTGSLERRPAGTRIVASVADDPMLIIAQVVPMMLIFGTVINTLSFLPNQHHWEVFDWRLLPIYLLWAAVVVIIRSDKHGLMHREPAYLTEFLSRTLKATPEIH